MAAGIGTLAPGMSIFFRRLEILGGNKDEKKHTSKAHCQCSSCPAVRVVLFENSSRNNISAVYRRRILDLLAVRFQGLEAPVFYRWFGFEPAFPPSALPGRTVFPTG